MKNILTKIAIAVLSLLVITESVIIWLDKAEEVRGEALGFILDTKEEDKDTRISDEENQKRIDSNLSYMQSLIDKYYLYETDEQKVEAGIYKGVMSGLEDPYAAYYTPEEYENMMTKQKGEYSGIGAILSQDPDTRIITVARLYEESPALEAGLQPEDIISKVDDISVADMELSDVVTLIKGKEGTQVTLEIYRQTSFEYMDFTITRKNIEIPTLTYRMLENKVGYIYLASWEEITPSQYVEAVETLEKQGMEKLIVDLRDNPGGSYQAVCRILDYMVADGKTLVYTLTKDGEKNEVKGSDGHSFQKPLAVLVNGNSASASEIFAGGIKDYKAGVIVGTTTYGKGIVQRFLELGNGAAMKFTVSEYYLPSGVSIHKKGVEPDVVEELSENLKTKSTITEKDDNQLQKAIAVLEKK